MYINLLYKPFKFHYLHSFTNFLNLFCLCHYSEYINLNRVRSLHTHLGVNDVENVVLSDLLLSFSRRIYDYIVLVVKVSVNRTSSTVKVYLFFRMVFLDCVLIFIRDI